MMSPGSFTLGLAAPPVIFGGCKAGADTYVYASLVVNSPIGAPWERGRPRPRTANTATMAATAPAMMRGLPRGRGAAAGLVPSGAPTLGNAKSVSSSAAAQHPAPTR